MLGVIFLAAQLLARTGEVHILFLFTHVCCIKTPLCCSGDTWRRMGGVVCYESGLGCSCRIGRYRRPGLRGERGEGVASLQSDRQQWLLWRRLSRSVGTVRTDWWRWVWRCWCQCRWEVAAICFSSLIDISLENICQSMTQTNNHDMCLYLLDWALLCFGFARDAFHHSHRIHRIRRTKTGIGYIISGSLMLFCM